MFAPHGARVRDGERLSPDAPKSTSDPLWMAQLDWPAIIHDLGLGHPLKFLWEEKAQQLTTYSNFWKQFYRKFRQYREASVTVREFEPGERVEVDYAGEPLEGIELKSGEIRKAWVFVAPAEGHRRFFRGHDFSIFFANARPAMIRPNNTMAAMSGDHPSSVRLSTGMDWLWLLGYVRLMRGGRFIRR